MNPLLACLSQHRKFISVDENCFHHHHNTRWSFHILASPPSLNDWLLSDVTSFGFPPKRTKVLTFSLTDRQEEMSDPTDLNQFSPGPERGGKRIKLYVWFIESFETSFDKTLPWPPVELSDIWLFDLLAFCQKRTTIQKKADQRSPTSNYFLVSKTQNVKLWPVVTNILWWKVCYFTFFCSLSKSIWPRNLQVAAALERDPMLTIW